MSGTDRWFYRQVLIGVMAWSAAWAQRVDADPPDVYVSVKGPVAVAGDLPLDLADLPAGEYEFEAWGLGLATSRGHFRRDADGLSIQPWASATSLLYPPGVTHLVRGDARGWYHLSAAAVSGAFWGIGTRAVGNAQDRIDAATRAVAQATSPSELSHASIDLFEANAEKDDKSRVRNLWAGYFGAVWLGAGLEAWLFNPTATVLPAVEGGRSAVTFPRADRWSAVLRSAVVPGSGQRYLGRDARATVFSGLVAGAAASAILAQDAFLGARRDHLAAQRRLEAADSEADLRQAQADVGRTSSDRDARSRLRWILTGTTASLYVWNLVDAFFVGRSAERHAPPAWSIAPTASGVVMRLTFDFP